MYFNVHAFSFILSLVDIKMPSKKRKEKERHNFFKKASGNCKAMEELFQISAARKKIILTTN